MTEQKELLNKFGITLQGFKDFISSRLSSFKVPRSVQEEFIDVNGVYQEEAAFDATAYIALLTIITIKHKLKIEGVWELILKKDKVFIQDAVYFQVTFFTKNNTIYEKITGASVNTPSFTFNQDTSRNLITADILGTYSKTALKASEIDKYNLIKDSKYKEYAISQIGEFVRVGYIDDSKIHSGGN